LTLTAFEREFHLCDELFYVCFSACLRKEKKKLKQDLESIVVWQRTMSWLTTSFEHCLVHLWKSCLCMIPSVMLLKFDRTMFNDIDMLNRDKFKSKMENENHVNFVSFSFFRLVSIDCFLIFHRWFQSNVIVNDRCM
jgi:hypothetical protein